MKRKKASRQEVLATVERWLDETYDEGWHSARVQFVSCYPGVLEIHGEADETPIGVSFRHLIKELIKDLEDCDADCEEGAGGWRLRWAAELERAARIIRSPKRTQKKPRSS